MNVYLLRDSKKTLNYVLQKLLSTTDFLVDFNFLDFKESFSAYSSLHESFIFSTFWVLGGGLIGISGLYFV